MEIWETAAQADEYVASAIGDALEEAGFPEPRTTEFEIHDLTEAGELTVR